MPPNTGSSGQRFRRSEIGAFCQKCAIFGKESRGLAEAALVGYAPDDLVVGLFEIDHTGDIFVTHCTPPWGRSVWKVA